MDGVVFQLFRHLPDLYALQLRCRSHPQLAVKDHVLLRTKQTDGPQLRTPIERNASYQTFHRLASDEPLESLVLSVLAVAEHESSRTGKRAPSSVSVVLSHASSVQARSPWRQRQQ
jgi:hypothetical protein